MSLKQPVVFEILYDEISIYMCIITVVPLASAYYQKISKDAFHFSIKFFQFPGSITVIL